MNVEFDLDQVLGRFVDRTVGDVALMIHDRQHSPSRCDYDCEYWHGIEKSLRRVRASEILDVLSVAPAVEALRAAASEWAAEYDRVTFDSPGEKKWRAALRTASVLAGQRADLLIGGV